MFLVEIQVLPERLFLGHFKDHFVNLGDYRVSEIYCIVPYCRDRYFSIKKKVEEKFKMKFFFRRLPWSPHGILLASFHKTGHLKKGCSVSLKQRWTHVFYRVVPSILISIMYT